MSWSGPIKSEFNLLVGMRHRICCPIGLDTCYTMLSHRFIANKHRDLQREQLDSAGHETTAALTLTIESQFRVRATRSFVQFMANVICFGIFANEAQTPFMRSNKFSLPAFKFSSFLPPVDLLVLAIPNTCLLLHFCRLYSVFTSMLMLHYKWAWHFQSWKFNLLLGQRGMSDLSPSNKGL